MLRPQRHDEGDVTVTNDEGDVTVTIDEDEQAPVMCSS
jgi:hypothetical protein